MTRPHWSRALPALLILAALPAARAGPAPQALLVRLKSPPVPAAFSAQPKAQALAAVPPGTALGQQLTEDGIFRVEVTDGRPLAAAAAQLKAWPNVAAVEPDYEVTLTRRPNDPDYKRCQQQYLQALRAPKAWDVTVGSKGVTVCTIDSGVDVNHPDLKPNLAADPGINVLGISADAWPGMRRNASWTEGVSRDLTDEVGHGTLVAGVVGAAGGNRQGVVGVAWRTSLVACKAFGGTKSTISAVLPCFDYCRMRGARIIVASWGTKEQSSFLKNAVGRAVRAGALVVAAAGNSDSDNDRDPFIPAHYSTLFAGVVSVGASTAAGDKSDYSSWGHTSVDLFAPGDDICSTAAGGGSAMASGTSLSVPLVAGAAALMASASGNRLRGGRLKVLLRQSVDRLMDLQLLCKSGGQLNLARAVYLAKGKCYPPDGKCKSKP